MNWPLFTNPALLGALAAVAIPVLVHLLLKSRSQRMRFSTLRFFKQQDPRATQRRKLRNWLLLTLRTLIIILLALGFARPYLSGNSAAAANGTRRQVIYLLDRSASMLAADHEGPRWPRALQALRKSLDTLGPQDLATLISCGPRAENLRGPVPAKDIVPLLSTLQPLPAAAEIGPGLDLAAKMAYNSETSYSNTICVVSDLQRGSCRDLAAHPIPVQTGLEFLNIGDRFAPNHAVTQLQLTTGTNNSGPGALVANFSNDDAAALKAQLWLDGKEAQTLNFATRSNNTTNVTLNLPRLTPGWHTAEFRLLSGDALALDNVRYRTLNVPPPVRVLVVEPHPELPVFRQESFFVVSALDPAFGTSNSIPSPFQITKAAATDVAAWLTAGTNAPQIVVLPALGILPPGLGAKLNAFVQAGGGLLLFVGEAVNAVRYAGELGDLLPAQLGTAEASGENEWRLWEKDAQSPMFSVFNRPNSGNLTIAKFTHRVALTAVNDSTVHARFQDGVPVVLSREPGKGRVVLVNTTADTRWSDWPKHRTYVPWVHSAARYLAGNFQTVEANDDLAPGTLADLALGANFKNLPCKLQRPAAPELLGTTDVAGVWRDCPLEAPGVYTIRDAGGRELRRFAVNAPAAESDLSALSAVEFEQQTIRANPTTSPTLAASLLAGNPGRLELWRLCLLAALGLMLVEVALANRTYA